MPITSSTLVISEVGGDCTVKSFCEEKKLEPSYNNLSILLEFNGIDKSDKDIRDVILMDKVLVFNTMSSS